MACLCGLLDPKLGQRAVSGNGEILREVVGVIDALSVTDEEEVMVIV